MLSPRCLIPGEENLSAKKQTENVLVFVRDRLSTKQNNVGIILKRGMKAPKAETKNEILLIAFILNYD